MNIETLKINLVQQILNISDNQILEKVKDLLNVETIVGYETNGTPVTKIEFIEDLKKIEQQIEDGTLKTYSTDEVRKQILNR